MLVSLPLYNPPVICQYLEQRLKSYDALVSKRNEVDELIKNEIVVLERLIESLIYVQSGMPKL